MSPTSSWIQLSLFTLFLFLLVAIPYTVYLKAAAPQKVVIANLPESVVTPKVINITPPPPSATTTCIPVPNTYTYTVATPAAYLFQEKQRQVCFPPSLPPYPFTWQTYINYQAGFTLDKPKNWTDISNAISFTWQEGQDPYATDSSYVKMPITRDNHMGAVYTKNASFIGAVFPLKTGYVSIQTSRTDASFFAFQHVLDSLQFITH